MKSFKIFMEETGFTYDLLAGRMWRDKFADAKKKFKVSFDLENDEKVSERLIEIDQDHWESSKCKFLCQLRIAAGDWEKSSHYFRCQLVSGYALDLSAYRDPYFCVIPDRSNGNSHLVKEKDGWIAPDAEYSGPESKVKPDESKSWKFLKKHLEELVQKEIEKVR